ncbi:MAG: ABC transporter permease [Chloroflexi bacterium]|nr:ABC transporter permease [Chloroflexota bacterium]
MENGPSVAARPKSTGVGRIRVAEFVSAHFGVLSILVVFAVLFVFFSLRANAFFTTENLLNVGRQVAPTVVVGTLMTFVITTGAIDLSVGSVVGLSAAALALIAKTADPLLAIAITLGLGAAIGFINGYLSAYSRLQSFIVTLAALTAVRGAALLITQGYSTPITSDWILEIGQGQFLGVYTSTWIAIIVATVGWYVFSQTRYGRYIVAVGSNSESLRRAGVDIRRVQLWAFVATSVIAAFAGIMTAARLASGSSNSGTGFELEVITAVVLGGTSLLGGRGSIVGTVIGAMTLGIISNGLVLLHIDVYWVPITQGLILIVAIFLNSKLFARLVGRAR